MAVQLNPPLSIWMQLASLFFACSGLNGDLLVIRLFLFLAYVMLFLGAALGGPMWPSVVRPGSLSLDGLVWAIIGVYVHGSSLACLFLDERNVKLRDDEAALWRLLYRTGGLSQKLFETEILPYLKVVTVGRGQPVDTLEHFSIVYRGRVRLRVVGTEDGVVREDRIKVAGEMFDFKHLDLLHGDSVFFAHQIHCSAVSEEVVLFQFRKKDMRCIAHHPFGKSLWQALLINNLSNLVEEFLVSDRVARDGKANGSTEIDNGDDGHDDDDNDDESDDRRRMEALFGPLRDWELPMADAAGSGAALRRPVSHVWRSGLRALNFPWPLGRHPTGIRQTQLRAPPPFPPHDADGDGGHNRRGAGRTAEASAGASARRGSALELLPARSFHRWSLANRRGRVPPPSRQAAAAASTGPPAGAASRLRNPEQPREAVEVGYGAVATTAGGSREAAAAAAVDAAAEA